MSQVCNFLIRVCCLAWLFWAPAIHALNVSPAKDPNQVLQALFPQAQWSDKREETDQQGKLLKFWQIQQEGNPIAYAFETNDIRKIPAYSGEPVNMLVAFSPTGEFLHAVVLEHHEPILLVGIPEQ